MLETLAVLLVFQCLGELLVRLTGIPVPGPVIGMMLLFLALCAQGSIPRNLGKSADFLVRHLALFFLPAGTGIFFLAPELNRQLPALLTAILLSTAAALLLTGWLIQRGNRKFDG